MKRSEGGRGSSKIAAVKFNQETTCCFKKYGTPLRAALLFSENETRCCFPVTSERLGFPSPRPRVSARFSGSQPAGQPPPACTQFTRPSSPRQCCHRRPHPPPPLAQESPAALPNQNISMVTGQAFLTHIHRLPSPGNLWMWGRYYGVISEEREPPRPPSLPPSPRPHLQSF